MCIWFLALLFVSGAWGSCWSGIFRWSTCCDPAVFGPEGNPTCWDAAFTHERCCGERGEEESDADTVFAEAMAFNISHDLGGSARAEAMDVISPGIVSAWQQCRDAFEDAMSAAGRSLFDGITVNMPMWVVGGFEAHHYESICLNGTGALAGRFFYVSAVKARHFQEGHELRPQRFQLWWGMCVPRNCSEMAAGRWLVGLCALDRASPLQGDPVPALAIPYKYEQPVRHVWRFVDVDASGKPMGRKHEGEFFLTSSEMQQMGEGGYVALVGVFLLLFPAIAASWWSCLLIAFYKEKAATPSFRKNMYSLLVSSRCQHDVSADIVRVLLTGAAVLHHVKDQVPWQEEPGGGAGNLGYWPLALCSSRVNTGFVALAVYLATKQNATAGQAAEPMKLHFAKHAVQDFLTRWVRVAPLAAFWICILLVIHDLELHAVPALRNPGLFLWYEVAAAQCAESVPTSLSFFSELLYCTNPCLNLRIFETSILLSFLLRRLQQFAVFRRAGPFAALWATTVGTLSYLHYLRLFPGWSCQGHSISQLLPSALAYAAFDRALQNYSQELPAVILGFASMFVTVALDFAGNVADEAPLAVWAYYAYELPLLLGLAMVLRSGRQAMYGGSCSTAAPTRFSLRLLRVGAQLSLGVNMCNLPITHWLGSTALVQSKMLLTPTWSHSLLIWLAVYCSSTMFAILSFVLIEAPWTQLLRPLLNYQARDLDMKHWCSANSGDVGNAGLETTVTVGEHKVTTKQIVDQDLHAANRRRSGFAHRVGLPRCGHTAKKHSKFLSPARLQTQLRQLRARDRHLKTLQQRMDARINQLELECSCARWYAKLAACFAWALACAWALREGLSSSVIERTLARAGILST